MYTNIIYHIVVVALLTLISVTKAEVDCSEHPHFVHPHECCPISLITDQIRETCEEFMKPPGGPQGGMGGNNDGNPGPPGGVGGYGGPRGINRHGRGHHHQHHHHCFFSCVLNQTGIMPDGKLQEDHLNEYLNEALDDPDTIDLIGNNFRKCSEKMSNMPVKKGPRHGPPHHHPCPYGSGMVLGCVHMKTFKECPKSIWTDTEECNAARDHWNECHHHPGDDIDVVEEEEDDEEI